MRMMPPPPILQPNPELPPMNDENRIALYLCFWLPVLMGVLFALVMLIMIDRHHEAKPSLACTCAATASEVTP